MRHVLIANIEGGMLSIAHRGDIHAIDIKSTADLEALAWAISQGEYPTVRTVMVDNVTELQTLNLQENVLAAIAGGRNRVKNRERTVDDVWQEDYLRSTKQLSRIFRFLRDLDVNTILTAHAKYVYPKMPEGTDLTKLEPDKIVPSLSQQLMKAVMGYQDFVWTMEVDEETQQRFLV